MTDSGSDTGAVWNYQLRIVRGRAVEEAPQIGFAERLDGRGRLVRLAMLAEPAAEGAEPFIDQFVRRVGERFDPAQRSLTGAIQVSITIAHDELRAWNRQRLAVEHVMYGLSCLIVREDQPALLCQVGPTLALAAGDPGVAETRPLHLHDHVRGRSGYAARPEAAPIGGSAPLVFDFAIAGQDSEPACGSDGWALLLTTNCAPLLTAERRVRLSRLPTSELLPALYPSLLELRDAAAFAVSLGGVSDSSDDAVEASEEATEASRETGRAPNAQDREIQRSDSTVRAGHGASVVATPAPLEMQTQSVRFEPVAVQGGAETAWPENPFVAEPEVELGRGGAGAVSLPRAFPARPRMSLREVLPSLQTPGVEQALQRPQAVARDTATAWRRAGLALLLMLLILVGVAAALLGPLLLRSDDDDLRLHIERAANGLAAAELAPDTDSARLALVDALDEARAALEINPLDAGALALRAEIEAVLAELTRVLTPGSLRTLIDLSGFGPAISVGAVVGGAGERLFLLDQAGGRVFAVDWSGGASVIYLEGELLGVDQQQRAGQPLSIAAQAVTDGGETTLWILDSQARLYRWTAGGVLLMPIPQQDRLGSVDAIAAGASDLFVLDRAGGAVWSFGIERASLAEPQRVVGRTDLHTATELIAITHEGATELVFATADGQLRRFRGNEAQPVDLTLERELLSPASLSFGSESGLLYLADRGNGRVLALQPDGRVHSQIQSVELADLRGVWVDEQDNRILYALPDRLLQGRLPSGQE